MFRISLIAAICIAGVLNADIGVAASQRFDQMVFSFPTDREYSYYYDGDTNALVLNIKATNSSELEALDRYDEKLIRRVLVKDLAQEGVEVKIILRDDNVRATVAAFSEPFRIAIDLFENGYQEQRDPSTGLPQAMQDEGPSAPATAEDNRLPASPSQSGAWGSGHQLVSPPEEKREARVLPPRPGSGAATTDDDDSGRMRLLQPSPKEIKDPGAAMADIGKAATGPGKGWADYPVYVYRLQTAPYKTGKNYDRWLNDSNLKAQTSTEAIADYASKLYDFGHEGKALIAYQQVLHKAPLLFSKSPVHLWKLAEIHLGQGNLTLADGYYQSHIEKHPDSELAKFAMMRRLDVKAIRLLQSAQPGGFPKLASELESIGAGANAELQAQLAIRRAFWSPRDRQALGTVITDKYFLPPLDAPTATLLDRAYKKVESNWTAFLASSLILNDALDAKKPWQAKTTELAEVYFRQYKGPKVEPITVRLEDKMRNVLNTMIREHVLNKKFVEAIQVYEGLPSDLKQIGQNPDTGWAMGEAYRNLGQTDKGSDFYAESAKRDEGTLRFKSLFWRAVTAGDAMTLVRRDNAAASRFRKNMEAADAQMLESWQKLKATEKKQVLTEMKPDLEAAVSGQALLQTPARVLLDAWSRTLSTEVAAGSEDMGDLKSTYSPTAATVRLLSDLSQKFGKLGLKEERQQSLKLLSRVQPSQFANDKGAMEIWANDLSGFAEELRQDNNYLESGRTYTLIGTERANWEGRAEALYKGGLLLYRAGRRAEAIEAFKKASEDGNNLMYADLAKSRLNQLQQ